MKKNLISKMCIIIVAMIRLCSEYLNKQKINESVYESSIQHYLDK